MTALIDHWRAALASEFGIALTVSDPNIIGELYAARKAAADPALEALSITKMANGELWIVKKDVAMEEMDAPTLT